MDDLLLKTQGWKAYPHHIDVNIQMVDDVLAWLDSKYTQEDNMWKLWGINTFGFKSERDAIWVALKWGKDV